MSVAQDETPRGPLGDNAVQVGMEVELLAPGMPTSRSRPEPRRVVDRLWKLEQAGRCRRRISASRITPPAWGGRYRGLSQGPLDAGCPQDG